MKIRTNFVSNSSTCSFIIPLKFISEEQKEKIWEWYNKKAENTYMDDEGASIQYKGQFLVGQIAYVQQEFLAVAEISGINRDDILLMEY